jgi:hypothetical protein
MTGPDRMRVATELQATAGILGRRLSEDVAAAYVRALDDLDAETLLRVLHRLARTAESGTRFPTPAELRQRCGGTVVAPDAPLSDAALDRVRQALYTALAAWEHAGAAGSARPLFERVWRTARQHEGGAGSVQQREYLWQTWLAAGPPVTRAAMAATLRVVAPPAGRGRDQSDHPRARQ